MRKLNLKPESRQQYWIILSEFKKKGQIRLVHDLNPEKDKKKEYWLEATEGRSKWKNFGEAFYVS